MNILECIMVALSSLWANKMRSFLTMLGIIIGISSVITIISIGQGSQATISSEFEKFGSNRVYIGLSWQENLKNRDYFDQSDVERVQNILKDDIKAISPRHSLDNVKIKKGRSEEKAYIYGVNEQFIDIENFKIVKGRFMNKADYLGRRNIAIIDKKLALEIFNRENVVGERILVDTDYTKFSVTIVGVYDMLDSAMGKLFNAGEQPTDVYVPMSLLQKLGYGERYYSLEVNMQDSSNIEKTSEKIINVIERKHKNSGENKYFYESAKKQMEMADNVLGIISKVIGAIAAISLLVGGIGVMNIMLVSVTERTREIGIRKAIGARRKDIMIQFLIEAMIISGIGGLIGTLLGLGIATLIALVMGIPPKVSIASIIIAITFSASVGIFFGLYPANKASKLDPIDALRYE